MEVMAVKKALSILSLLQEEGELGVTEIGKALGLNKSTVYRLLFTLKQDGYVEQNMTNEKYRLGIKLYSLGMTVNRSISLKGFVRPVLKELGDAIHEFIHFSVLSYQEETGALEGSLPKLIVVDRIESKHPSALMPVLKHESPCHSSAMGKCLLAYSSDVYLQQYEGTDLPSFTSRTITDWKVLKENLATIRSLGYAEEIGELEIGLACIAFPVFDANRKILGSFSVSGAEERIRSKRDMLIESMGKASERLSFIYRN